MRSWTQEAQEPGSELLTGGDLYEEILRRILIVGPYPRYTLGWDNFQDRVTAISTAVGLLGLGSGQEALLKGALNRAFDIESGKLQTTSTRTSRDPRSGPSAALRGTSSTHCRFT